MLEIGICEDVSMQGSGYFFNRFGDIHQHASRKMVKNGSKALRGLTNSSRMAECMCSYPSSCHLQLWAHLSSERVDELSDFEGLLSTGEL